MHLGVMLRIQQIRRANPQLAIEIATELASYSKPNRQRPLNDELNARLLSRPEAVGPGLDNMMTDR
jgi:hypothetical protein